MRSWKIYSKNLKDGITAYDCYKNIDQDGPYVYNKGCGWCDFKKICHTHHYCNQCCTAKDSPNNCRAAIWENDSNTDKTSSEDENWEVKFFTSNKNVPKTIV